MYSIGVAAWLCPTIPQNTSAAKPDSTAEAAKANKPPAKPTRLRTTPVFIPITSDARMIAPRTTSSKSPMKLLLFGLCGPQQNWNRLPVQGNRADLRNAEDISGALIRQSEGNRVVPSLRLSNQHAIRNGISVNRTVRKDRRRVAIH